MTQRVPGFAAGTSKDEGWVTVKVQLRPQVRAALQEEAQEESARTGRQVYVSDLIRDGVTMLLLGRRRLPGQDRRFGGPPPPAEAPEPRFVPSAKSEARAGAVPLPDPSAPAALLRR